MPNEVIDHVLSFANEPKSMYSRPSKSLLVCKNWYDISLGQVEEKVDFAHFRAFLGDENKAPKRLLMLAIIMQYKGLNWGYVEFRIHLHDMDYHEYMVMQYGKMEGSILRLGGNHIDKMDLKHYTGWGCDFDTYDIVVDAPHLFKKVGEIKVFGFKKEVPQPEDELRRFVKIARDGSYELDKKGFWDAARSGDFVYRVYKNVTELRGFWKP